MCLFSEHLKSSSSRRHDASPELLSYRALQPLCPLNEHRIPQLGLDRRQDMEVEDPLGGGRAEVAKDAAEDGLDRRAFDAGGVGIESGLRRKSALESSCLVLRACSRSGGDVVST